MHLKQGIHRKYVLVPADNAANNVVVVCRLYYILDLNLSIVNGFVCSTKYDKRDDFDFDIVNFPFLDNDVPRRASYGVYVSQLIRFA